MNRLVVIPIAIFLFIVGCGLSTEAKIDAQDTKEQTIFDAKFKQYRQLEMIYSGHTRQKTARRIAWLTLEYAELRQLSPLLIASIIIEESWVKPWALGKAGEIGLMQIHPEYWRGVYPECGKNLWNIRTNICYGTNILKLNIEKSDFDIIDALHGYNGRVNRPDSIQKYSDKILSRLDSLYLLTYNKSDTLEE